MNANHVKRQRRKTDDGDDKQNTFAYKSGCITGGYFFSTPSIVPLSLLHGHDGIATATAVP